ncbi:2-C-methyl-D-erythritol 4-phosphate cytidylyltransferase [Paenibacillus sp. DXFW5]|uniref:2-C-methyl-D-erythritol 4-phosphate cytidylyltransferase n=1 Tax=Paenibacillus rhizolycopersici TaxID=2780073 RepID=A0ABS2H921_9BACL|nr:2-C-methyl-D-erythritol 4-phosphate cytidylyltransferase [Paenibacillus rhizolycopersici]MBM6997915.1 2-C-methyl-D-erythritol 4-phosphate cytidylyltransferase [Paenibacillus rhizolycopersici]
MGLQASGDTGVIVVAAGRGTRMGTVESKQYLMLDGKPIFIHTLEVFHRHPSISQIVLVTGEQDVDRCRSWIAEYGMAEQIQVIPGGAERQHSVRQGLLSLSTPWVLVHDGVRPFVTREQITACCEAARTYGAAVLAVPVKDTIKLADEQGWVAATLDRRSLWAIQTPQAFRRADLLAAHERAAEDEFVGTDDAMLVERLSISVKLVEGAYDNIKITTPEDLGYAEFIRVKRE